ncbi:hypothetical protein [Spirosoma pollinicola]|uniref:O-antigen polysaccharide polymerase Wzy n=1 Tax=Spirosoma pollinicola TaxID=2057025 RepID=A0A2K8Z969_9BACT|nr:hypothetical protein [Spirosoma pollinicola]AUD06415.1 hypothetical protein CWM47_34000 [Spirosoma pollinicola]
MTLQATASQFKTTVLNQRPKAGFLSQFVFWSWVILLFASVLQIILFYTPDNLIAIGCVLGAWVLTTTIFLRPLLLKNFPFSAFLIIGFVFTQFYFPLVFTLLEGKPLIYNLQLPEEVFLHSMLALIVLIISHTIYWMFANQVQLSTKAPKLLTGLGIFSVPTDLQVWLIGFTGLTAMFYVHFYSPSVGHQVSGGADKLVEALIPFTYAPFFIPFGKLYGKKEPPKTRLTFQLIAFTLLLFVVSMGTNSRGAFMLGFTSVGFTFGLGLLLEIVKTRLFTLKNLAIGLFALWLFTGPIADIGTAMVMVRSLRADTPRMELIALTLDAYTQKDALKAFQQENTSKGEDWDEEYMDNIFLARFCNLKYNDASLILASKTGKQNPAIYEFTIDHFLSTLPVPVLDFLNLDVEKDVVNTVSFGDYLYYRVSGDAWSLGVFRTGHFAGTGMAAFGWWYLLILGIGMLPIYMLYDILFVKKPTLDKNGNSDLILQFSFCGLLGLTSIFQFFPMESVEGIAAFLLRGWVQKIFLYALIYHLTRSISAVVTMMTSVRLQKASLTRLDQAK